MQVLSRFRSGATNETPHEGEQRNELAQREEKKRRKKADENVARKAAAEKAANDAVQLLVGRLTDDELLTFCKALRVADYRFKEALERARIATESVIEVA